MSLTNELIPKLLLRRLSVGDTGPFLHACVVLPSGRKQRGLRKYHSVWREQ